MRIWLVIALALAGCKDESKKAAAPRDAAAAAAVDAAGQPAKVVKVTMIAPKIGERHTEETTSESTMTIGGEEMKEAETSKKTIEVVAVAGHAIAKAKVVYEQHEVTRASGANSDAARSAVAGNRYVVWKEGGKVKATREDGKAVSEEEQAVFAEDFLEIGDVPVILQLVTGRTWTQGERVDLTGDQLTALGKARTGGDAAVQPAGGWLALTVLDGERATFDAELKVVREDKGMKVESTILSTIDLEVKTGRIHSLTTTGTVKGEVKGKKPAPLAGTLKSTLTFTYGAAK